MRSPGVPLISFRRSLFTGSLLFDGPTTPPAANSPASRPPAAHGAPTTASATMDLSSDDDGFALQVQSLRDHLSRIRDAVGQTIRGKDDVVDQVLMSMLAGGSILLEDVPGVGKTTLAKSITTLMGLDFGRVQCTPDLLPADILGGPIFRPGTGEFEFRPGPIFCHLLIADEINRASPRTQSALLEAMAESQVTIDGTRYDLRRPFIVIATQNPGGFEGTYPLPESQLDRFLIRLAMDYPDADAEVALLLDPPQTEIVSAIVTADQFANYQSVVSRIGVRRRVAEYLVDVVTATRADPRVQIGVSPRGSKMWLSAAKATAAMDGRTFVLPDDLQQTAAAVLPHRMSAKSSSATHRDLCEIVADIVGRVAVPT